MKKFDVLVAGGGFAGTAAAISAARGGKKVMLFDKFNAPGGAAAVNLVTPFMPYWTINKERNKREYLTGGIFSEIVGKLRELGAMEGDDKFSDEYLKLVLNRMIKEAGVTVLYHAYLKDVEKEGKSIKSVTVSALGQEIKIAADTFIDATGDGVLSYLAGCSFMLGRNGDNLCQPMTLCFRVANVDVGRFYAEMPEMQKLYKEKQSSGEIRNPRENILTFVVPAKGIIHFNTTRVVKLNPTDPFDVTEAEFAAREQVFELFDLLKASFSSMKDADLIMTAAGIGVRESRMIEGEHILTANDLKECTKFPDSVARGNYDIDIHNPEGTGTSHYYFAPEEYYTIPYRSLTVKDADNLLVAGRCISADHEAQASIRIMPICASTGEAAGIAASLAPGGKVKEVDIKALRERLTASGALI
mgnify:FL=1